MTRTRPTRFLSPGLLVLAACSSGGGTHAASDATTGDGEADVATEGGADGDSSSLAEAAPADATDANGDATTEAEAASEGGDAMEEGGDADATMGQDADATADAGAYDAPIRPDALLDDGGTCVGDCNDAAADSACATPDVAGNPPSPAGFQPLPQAQVTPAMTTWTVQILDDPPDFPMFSCATGTFGSLRVLARVEWLPPDFQHSSVHRGVLLLEPTD